MKKQMWQVLPITVLLVAVVLGVSVADAQGIRQERGVDQRVDYAALTQFGPWDDRNYNLRLEDLTFLASNERELRDPIPAFFRVEMRKRNQALSEPGAIYPRSALQIFQQLYRGYLHEGKIYRKVTVDDLGNFQLALDQGQALEEFDRALTSDVKVTSPTGAAESAVKIHPSNTNLVVAGSNGPGSGQKMWYSSNGGSSWTQSAALPLGSTCCDPTVDWSSNGQYAYAATLGSCTVSGCGVWFYRSADNGATWNNLETVTPGDPRRELTNNGSDKEYLHVDKFATSPFKDNLYMTWHNANVLKFKRSTDFGNTWSATINISTNSTKGIGSDIATDKNGNIFYFWPAISAKTIRVRKSTDGGGSFVTAVTVSTTQDGYDFAIPAMETRRAFIYVSADADLTNGTYANSVYAAWTDTTAPEQASPANNHGRIQVAYTRNAGTSWTVTTPHETVDQNSVDRFHPWLGVGPDGRVYVIYYDTRNSPTRVGVDIYYSVSADGAQTWSAPARLTSVTSPQVDDSFEWGDYNGLDVIGTQLISIFTDNRNEGGGAADSIDVYAAGKTVP